MSTNESDGGTDDQRPPGQSPDVRMEMDTDTEDEHMEDSSDDEIFMSSSDEMSIPSPPPVPPPAIMGPIGYRPDASISASASATLNTTFWDTLMPSSIFPGIRVTRGMPRSANTVSRNLKVFSIAMLPHARPELENGGKSKSY